MRILSWFAVFLGATTVLLAIWGAVEIGPQIAHAVAIGGGLVFAGLGVVSLRQAREKSTPDHRFLAWLRDHARQVSEGTALYEGVPITTRTRLVRYTFVYSVVVMTVRQPSRLYIEGVERTGLVNAAYTLCTLIFGWWGIPWGPIYSLGALYSNLTGRDAVTVGEILHAVAAEPEAKPERA